MDARRTPKRIVAAHLADQIAQFGIDRGAPASVPGFPAPPRTPTRAMPLDDRPRLNDDERIQKAGTEPVKPGKQRPITAEKPYPLRSFAAQDIQLMAEDENLSVEMSARPKAVANEAEQQIHEPCHWPLSWL